MSPDQAVQELKKRGFSPERASAFHKEIKKVRNGQQCTPADLIALAEKHSVHPNDLLDVRALTTILSATSPSRWVQK